MNRFFTRNEKENKKLQTLYISFINNYSRYLELLKSFKK